jgi:Protein of unknown function (DUF3309)
MPFCRDCATWHTSCSYHYREENRKKVADMGIILLIVLVLLLVGGLPNWGFHKFGFAPSGIVGAVLLIVVVLLLTGRL